MATILLQAAGAAFGGALGPIGSAIGSAAGAMAGYFIDRAIINGLQRIEGPRLTGARPFTAEEGASIPRVYGVARMGGLVIWATRFEESRTTTRQGIKGGPRVTEYSYFANVAFALCEGEIAGVRRIWADGKELDRTLHEIRVYTGAETQEPDPLIEAKQGADNAPAYRGTAYVVFERFPLADYGNRIPQLQFEVLRPVGEFHKRVRGVALIPGATEYGLSPTLITREVQPGETQALNRHVLYGTTNLVAALDELQMLCPNLQHIALVATWFGDDLRAGECKIRPMVTDNTSTNFSEPWVVSGLERTEALQVSYHDGGAAYGGSPSDKTIIDAIKEVRKRRLKVTLYPFIMMDVPPDNGLPDPHGGAAQAPYPWRGRISCYPGPAQPGSADKTADARMQVEAFCGVATPADFNVLADAITFTGDAAEWSYRRFLLHFAHLAAAAGGVDAFLVGTELRGLTTLRDAGNAFPFVETLCALADEVRGVLGPATEITYGADWSEYFGHQPSDGSGDAFFHLDPLWSHPEIAAVGIDNYMPLSDWRDADYGGGNADGFQTPYDIEGLTAAIAGGEGFDWYYSSAEARAARERAPITDGSGKPWVYRYKDLVNWWSNPHYDRLGGVEVASPTGWMPRSKPIWFTELGCPAVDKGPNQPNVFPDPKSSESASPYFSGGGRSDIAQRRFLEAHQRYWDPALTGFQEARNPMSAVYDGRMLDHTRTLLWAWDARPFPAFPLRGDEWRDGGNWHLGHWLNGRLDASSCSDLINAILTDHGAPEADTTYAEGMVQGYVVQDPSTARAALEPLTDLFGIIALDGPAQMAFRLEGAGASDAMTVDDLALHGGAALDIARTPDHELPREAVLGLRELFLEYQATAPRSRRLGAVGSRQQTVHFPGSIETGQAQSLLDDWMKRLWTERQGVTFSVAPAEVDIEPGTIIRLPAANAEFLVTNIEEGLIRTVNAKQIARVSPTPWRGSGAASTAPVVPILAGRPDASLLDLPMGIEETAPETRLRIAAWQKPWRSQAVYASPDASGFTLRGVVTTPAVIGRLMEPLGGNGFEGRVDRGTSITVKLSSGELASVSRLQLLNGANAAAIRSASAAWEVVQFEAAEEIAPDIWRLGNLLRGQSGTNDAMAAGAPAGAIFVLLDHAVVPAGLSAGEVGLERNWRVGPVGFEITPANFVEEAATGGVRAQLPLSPVHLRARPDDAGNVTLSWIRRGRFGGDDWQQSEIPLAETLEEYRIEIAAAGGPVLRAATSTTTHWIYTAASIAADFGTMPPELDVTVRQRSTAVGWGIPATRRLATD
ncbi:baseplate multidomain protein megatron [Arvimicrobium flavum]|uniref:baseplate multidomain protein megatron n=1 Tax=Arvimicrobium flavum TaxID=3393320 RepID=UPI00237B312E|nr:glycoside hydrolase/phage tail family protein [Mesorhizobium shangrilense]